MNYVSNTLRSLESSQIFELNVSLTVENVVNELRVTFIPESYDFKIAVLTVVGRLTK